MDELVPIGKVFAAHGLRGELKVRSFNADSALLQELDEVLLRWEDGEPGRVGVLRARLTPKAWILSLDGVSDRNSAEALRGAELCVPRSWLPEPDEDEVYYCDLEGCVVSSASGEVLGEVVGVFDSGANDVLTLRKADGGEAMIPFVDAMIVELDVSAKRLVVDLPEGLLEP